MSNVEAVMADINDLGIGTPEYHEALWFLFSILARRQYAIAESIRTNQRKRERAAATRAQRRTPPGVSS